eukprot:scaffold1284_cov108-Cylindrotheca_fusiformis.AAC.3
MSRYQEECVDKGQDNFIGEVGDVFRGPITCGGLEKLSECSLGEVGRKCCQCIKTIEDCVNITDKGYQRTILDHYGCENDTDYVAVFLGLSALVCWIVGVVVQSRRYQSRQAARRQRILEMQARPASAATASNVDSAARQKEIMTRFHFETVRKDMRNISAESIRHNASKEDESSSLSEDQVYSIRQQFSSWMNKSSEECSICLEGYQPGETIGVAIAADCNHVFHEDCVVKWLQKHDQCPLCRLDLMATTTSTDTVISGTNATASGDSSTRQSSQNAGP